jgi:hypothetical protein
MKVLSCIFLSGASAEDISIQDLQELENTTDIIEVEPGCVLLVSGDCFHGGCQNTPPPKEAKQSNKGNKDKPDYGKVRLHGYITTPVFHIGEEELEQGWYHHYIGKKVEAANDGIPL